MGAPGNRPTLPRSLSQSLSLISPATRPVPTGLEGRLCCGGSVADVGEVEVKEREKPAHAAVWGFLPRMRRVGAEAA